MDKSVLIIIVISLLVFFYGGIGLLKLNAILKLKKENKKNNEKSQDVIL